MVAARGRVLTVYKMYNSSRVNQKHAWIGSRGYWGGGSVMYIGVEARAGRGPSLRRIGLAVGRGRIGWSYRAARCVRIGAGFVCEGAVQEYKSELARGMS
jgi:hypothetical protein